MTDYPAVAEIVREEIGRAGYVQNSCILAARLTTLALRQRGERVEAMAAEVSSLSPAYVAMQEHIDELGRQLTAEETRPFEQAGAWRVILSFDPPEPGTIDRRGVRGYNGHVVTVVDRCWLIDPTLPQINRPQKGLVVEPPFAWEVDYEEARTQGFTVVSDHGTTVHYKLLPGRRDFTKAPDWRRGAGERVLARIVERINEVEHAHR